MADYYPLLARALSALPDRSPALRRAVYDRARNALITQLRTLEPPLSDADIDLESRALDAAIDRLERENGAVPAPANDAVPEPVAPRAGLEPTLEAAPQIPESSPPEPSPEPVRPALPPAEPPSFVPVLPLSEPERREAPISIVARRPAQPLSEPSAPDTTSPAAEGASEGAETAAEAANGRQRPRIAVVPPRSGRSRGLRNAFVGIVLAVVIGLIAVTAYLLRDRPQALQPGGVATADSQQSDTEAKFGDRVGGGSAPAERPRADGAASTRSSAPARGAATPAQQNLPVSQRAALIEENTAGQGGQPTTVPGRVTWRLDSVNGEQNQPLQAAVTATVTYPDAGLTLVMTIQRNLDDTLPASHTIKLAFSQTGPDAAARVVQDIGLLQAKDEEGARGSPVSGLPVRVRDNLFLIGLSSLRGDVDRNTDLLLHRNWFDLAIRYTSGKRAVLAFEKGAAGAQAIQGAFDAWQ